jgi:tetratricopeptide (TPR) repeat protein
LEICQVADWEDRDARIGDIYNQLGLCYRGLGDLKRAVESFKKALPLRQEHRGAVAVAATLTNWAFVYRHLEQLELALGYGKLGLAIRQRLDRAVQRQGRRLRELDYSHHVMGLIYREAGYFKDAIEHFDEALSIASEVEHRFMVGLANADLGYVYYLQEELEEAGHHLKEAERIFRAIDHHGGLANILSKLGRLYRKDEAQWEQAAAAFREGLALAEKVGDAYFAIDNLVNLAKLEHRQGLLDDAKIAGYQQKLDELRQGRYRFPLLLGIFENVLALFETKRGNYAAAAQHYAQEQRYMAEFSELHKRIFDSIDRLTDQLLTCSPADMVALSRQLTQQWKQQKMGTEAKVTVQICRMTEQVSEMLQG